MVLYLYSTIRIHGMAWHVLNRRMVKQVSRPDYLSHVDFNVQINSTAQVFSLKS